VFREKEIKARVFITRAPDVEAIIKAAERENADLIGLCQSRSNRVFQGTLWKCGGRYSASYRRAPAAYPVGLTDEEIDITVTEANAAYF